MIRYILPISAAILIYCLFLFLPPLRSCPLPEFEFSDKGEKRRSVSRSDIMPIGIISLLYLSVAFYALGYTKAPQSFAEFSGEQIVLKSECAENVEAVILYTGIGVGSYTIEFSEDSKGFDYACELQQDYIEILKWEKLESFSVLQPKYIRITACGSARLGELAILLTDGSLASLSVCENSVNTAEAYKLTDEQELVQTEQYYLNSTYFDEIYHVRTAYEHIERVEPYEISHPPLGKLIIALGIKLFGLTPFGWRFSGTLTGVLMLPLIYVFSKQIFGGHFTPSACTVLFASDFMHYTQTRIATIDSYAVFFIILMYLFMYRYITGHRDRDLLLCGLFFGLGAASKWTCLYAGAGLAIIWGGYWLVNAKRGFRAFVINNGKCLIFFVLIPAVIYYLSYIPYGLAKGVTPVFGKEYAQIVIQNQEFMFSYHSKLVAEHPYSSKWYEWLLNLRPILYYYKSFDGGLRSSFGAWLNPVLCWGGLGAIFVLAVPVMFRRDKNASFILLAYLAQLLPWIPISRLTFAYHYFPCSVFLCIALGYVFRLIEEKKSGRFAIIGFAALSCVLFILFYPSISGYPVDGETATRLLAWLPGWPF